MSEDFTRYQLRPTPNIIVGKLIEAGNLEADLVGCVVECSKEALTKNRLPLYEDVVILSEADYQKLITQS